VEVFYGQKFAPLCKNIRKVIRKAVKKIGYNHNMGRGGNLSEGNDNHGNPPPQMFHINGFEDWYVEINEAGEEVIHLVDSDSDGEGNGPGGNNHIHPHVAAAIPEEQDIMDVFWEIQNGEEPQHVEAGENPQDIDAGLEPQHVEAGEEPQDIDAGVEPQHGEAVVDMKDVGVQVNMVRGSHLKRRATRGRKGEQLGRGQPLKKRGRRNRLLGM